MFVSYVIHYTLRKGIRKGEEYILYFTFYTDNPRKLKWFWLWGCSRGWQLLALAFVSVTEFASLPACVCVCLSVSVCV